MDLRERWQSLVSRVAARGADSDRLFPEGERLLAAWSEPQRAYHTLAHLAACLAELPVPAADPEAVELALWYHDAVYDPRAGDNEARSAAWAERALTTAGQPALGHRVAEMVRATAGHHAEDADTAWVLDIDLSVLGRPEEEYDRFEAEVRAEYAWVPEEAFRAGRSRVLAGFLDRPRIFRSERFAAREEQARRNIDRALLALRS